MVLPCHSVHPWVTIALFVAVLGYHDGARAFIASPGCPRTFNQHKSRACSTPFNRPHLCTTLRLRPGKHHNFSADWVGNIRC